MGWRLLPWRSPAQVIHGMPFKGRFVHRPASLGMRTGETPMQQVLVPFQRFLREAVELYNDF